MFLRTLCVLVLLLAAPAVGQAANAKKPSATQTVPKPPAYITDGKNAGYTTGYTATREVVTFVHEKRNILTIKGHAAKKWHEYEQELGMCFLSYPELIYKIPGVGKGVIWRFDGGIIVQRNGEDPFYLDWTLARKWQKDTPLILVPPTATSSK